MTLGLANLAPIFSIIGNASALDEDPAPLIHLTGLRVPLGHPDQQADDADTQLAMRRRRHGVFTKYSNPSDARCGNIVKYILTAWRLAVLGNSRKPGEPEYQQFYRGVV